MERYYLTASEIFYASRKPRKQRNPAVALHALREEYKERNPILTGRSVKAVMYEEGDIPNIPCILYTDGSRKKESSGAVTASCAWILIVRETEISVLRGKAMLSECTSEEAEAAPLLLWKGAGNTTGNVILRTDSMGFMRAVNGGSDPCGVRGMTAGMQAEWIKGHSGDNRNSECHRMAAEARRGIL